MPLKKIFLLLALPCAALVGCDSNPTNAPSDAEVADAKKAQIAAIDADKTMTPEDKQRLKQAKGFVPGGIPGGPSTTDRK